MSRPAARGLGRVMLLALFSTGLVSRTVVDRESASLPPGLLRRAHRGLAFVFALRRLRIAGLSLLVLSPLLPWFSVPAPFTPDPGDAPFKLISAPVVAPAKGVLVAAVAAALALGWCRRRRGSVRACAPVALTAAVLLAALLSDENT